MGRYGFGGDKIREALVAGIFYPDDATVLANAVGKALADASIDTDYLGSPIAIVSPHAAFEYSACIQAAAWLSAARKAIDRVVIIASLRRPSEAAAYLPESNRFMTPLGDVVVDMEICAQLESCSTLFETNDIPHLEHHAIEVQLPFMRTLFPKALLVPILIGGDAFVASVLARAIDLVLGDKSDSTLFVASSNMASSPVAADADLRSLELLSMMASNDWRGVANMRGLSGAEALASTMAMRSIDASIYRLLCRSDSCRRIEPVNNRVVQYAAVAWYGGKAT